MRSELIKQFVKKTARKIIIFAFVMFVVAAVGQSVSPLITNQVALGQMQNSDEMYALMNTYNKLRPIINTVFTGIIIWFIYTIGRDTYKFVKNINIENEKEKN